MIDHRAEPEGRPGQIGRLSFRIEGINWCCYWCPRLDSMNNAVFLGAVNMHIINERPERKDEFITFMRELFGDKIEKIRGTRPTWSEVRAPEHERRKE